MKTADIPEISQLSVPEKLLLVEALWDDVREDAGALWAMKEQPLRGNR